MAIDADTLLDRMRLKQQLLRWRSLAILLLTLLALLLVHRNFNVTELSQADYIARITIEGLISTDHKRMEMLENIRENDSVKALIVYLDTPGGTAIGGEELYLALKRIRAEKPVAILMRTVCASAGYMTAVGGTRLFAREGTLTGSIGVIMQTFEASELAKNIGIEPIILRSGSNKAVPNPAEKLDPSKRKLLQNVVNDFHAFFLRIVQEERKFPDNKIATLTDGRVFTGRQALENGMIDAIGGEIEAREWLEKEHKLSTEMRIKTIKPKYPKENIFGRFDAIATKAMNKAENFSLGLDGLLLLWQPAATK